MGVTDGRFLNEIPTQTKIIKDNLWFGTGYMEDWHCNSVAE